MPQLDPSSFVSQLFWLVICFASLYFLLAKFALPKIGRILDLREDTIAKDLEQADLIRIQAERIEEEYNVALKSAKENAAKIFAQAEIKIKKDAENSLHELDKALAMQLKEAENQIGNLKIELKEKLENLATIVASQVVEKLIVTKIDDKLIRSTINNIK